MSGNTARKDPMKTLRRLQLIVLQVFLVVGFTVTVFAQTPGGNGRATTASGTPGSPVTIPLTIRVKEETELQNIDLTISEDGKPQTIISVRGITNSPITIAL